MYQHGIAEKVNLNANVSGVTKDQEFAIDFAEPMNFNDNTISLAKGEMCLK